MTSLGKTKHGAMKPSKYHRHLSSKLNHRLCRDSVLNSLSLSNYQIVPISSLWTSNSSSGLNSISTLPMNAPTIQTIHTSLKPFAPPKVTTTLIPLNICPSESSQATQSANTPTINRIDKMCIESSKSTFTTHQIGDWVIRESSQPFQRDAKSPRTSQKLSSNVKQWSVDDVCVFFEEVLGKSTFTPIIQDHSIDGFALLLLKDEHLDKIFKMQLGPRLKLLNRIQKLKSHLSD